MKAEEFGYLPVALELVGGILQRTSVPLDNLKDELDVGEKNVKRPCSIM